MATACDNNEYNALYGSTSVTACKTCPVSNPQYTSYAGAAYCTVPPTAITNCESESQLAAAAWRAAARRLPASTHALTTAPPTTRCAADGFGWEAASLTCVECRAGTYRAKDSPLGDECQDW